MRDSLESPLSCLVLSGLSRLSIVKLSIVKREALLLVMNFCPILRGSRVTERILFCLKPLFAAAITVLDA
jgi:hypothetical protein